MSDYINRSQAFLNLFGDTGGGDTGNTGAYSIDQSWGDAMGSYCPAGEPIVEENTYEMEFQPKKHILSLQDMIIIGLTILVAILLAIILTVV